MMQATATLILLFIAAVGRGALADDPNIRKRGNNLKQRVAILEDRFPDLISHLVWSDKNPEFTKWVNDNQFAKMAGRLSRVEEQLQQQEQCACLSKGVFACPSGYVEVGGKCLLFSNSLSNYEEAKNNCSKTGGQLAIIDNCNLLHGIALYLGDDDGPSYWVGATDIKEEGKWTWNDGSDVDKGATLWGRAITGGTFEPNGGDEENCLLMRTGYNYRFGDSICDDHIGKSPLCQYNDYTCSSPRVLLEGRCVEFLSNLELDWSEAGAKCVKKGGKLAKVDDCNFLGAIIAYLLNCGLTPTEGYWVGGSDSAQEGKWLWLDGSPVPMGAPYWDQVLAGTDLEPNNVNGAQNCGKLRGATRWMLDDIQCDGKENVLCEAPHIEIAA